MNVTVTPGDGVLDCESLHSDGWYVRWAVLSPDRIDLSRFERVEVKRPDGSTIAVLTGADRTPDRLLVALEEAGWT